MDFKYFNSSSLASIAIMSRRFQYLEKVLEFGPPKGVRLVYLADNMLMLGFIFVIIIIIIIILI